MRRWQRLLLWLTVVVALSVLDEDDVTYRAVDDPMRPACMTDPKAKACRMSLKLKGVEDKETGKDASLYYENVKFQESPYSVGVPFAFQANTDMLKRPSLDYAKYMVVMRHIAFFDLSRMCDELLRSCSYDDGNQALFENFLSVSHWRAAFEPDNGFFAVKSFIDEFGRPCAGLSKHCIEIETINRLGSSFPADERQLILRDGETTFPFDDKSMIGTTYFRRYTPFQYNARHKDIKPYVEVRFHLRAYDMGLDSSWSRSDGTDDIPLTEANDGKTQVVVGGAPITCDGPIGKGHFTFFDSVECDGKTEEATLQMIYDDVDDGWIHVAVRFREKNFTECKIQYVFGFSDAKNEFLIDTDASISTAIILGITLPLALCCCIAMWCYCKVKKKAKDVF